MRENGFMRYDEPLFRPPSEADSFILQATLGCSWNACTYCAMYRDKRYRVRLLEDVLADIAEAGARFAEDVRHVFVADGDPLGMELGMWEPILLALATAFPRLRRVSTYATARNLLVKSAGDLKRLRRSAIPCERRQPFALLSRVVVNDVVNSRSAFERRGCSRCSVLDMDETPHALARADDRHLLLAHLFAHVSVLRVPGARSVKKSVTHRDGVYSRCLKGCRFEFDIDARAGGDAG